MSGAPRTHARAAGAALAFALVATGTPARADDPALGSTMGCVETIPQGMQRPAITSQFPDRGTSGYVSVLRVEVEHGRGESVLPRGLELQTASDAARDLKLAGFALPEQDAGAGARLVTGEAATGPGGASAPAGEGRTKTILELPLVPLPSEPGRNTLYLPPMPIAVARASGEIATVCTRGHRLTVDDPTASTPDAMPKPNPPPRVQREEWTALRRAVEIGAIGALVGALLAYALYRFWKRPRPAPPPPPPRPAWEVALERLDEIRHAGLVSVGRYAEYFDRVSDTVRSYLGARYGFEGLELTTDEIMAALSRIATPGLVAAEVRAFLGECDLVKFANVKPTDEECARVIDAAERIVRSSMPRTHAFGGEAQETPEAAP